MCQKIISLRSDQQLGLQTLTNMHVNFRICNIICISVQCSSKLTLEDKSLDDWRNIINCPPGTWLAVVYAIMIVECQYVIRFY